MRVFNQATNAARELETIRCTVCKNEITRSRKSVEPDEKKGKGKGKPVTEVKIDKETVKPDKPVAGKKKK
jgi:copper chaperone CopZ